MIVTDNQEVAEHARILKDLAFRKEKRFLHQELGFNYHMNNVQAALGVAQLARMDQIIEKKRWIAEGYSTHFAEVEGLTLQVEEPWAKNVYWMCSLLVEDSFGVNRDEVMNRLRASVVGTRTFFIGMHAQPAFHNIGLFVGQQCPVADEIAAKGRYLPSGLNLTDDEIGYVCENLIAIQADPHASV